ncbi:hypothetical protein AGR1B_pa0241 [Agrobacterium fabacearum S56]|nr:hypothetical protein AGR1B_pa0241 [Agrobacterium fabacearum S56]
MGHSIFAAGRGEGSGEKGLAAWIISQTLSSYFAIAIGSALFVGGIVTFITSDLQIREIHQYSQQFIWALLRLSVGSNSPWNCIRCRWRVVCLCRLLSRPGLCWQDGRRGRVDAPVAGWRDQFRCHGGRSCCIRRL